MNIVEELANHPDIGRRCGSLTECLYPCLVPDLYDKLRTRIIFVLESPHTAEVKKGYPLAGASGRTVTGFVSEELFGGGLPDEPLGALLAGGDERLQSFGILNVSNLPLQADSYPPELRKPLRPLLSAFATLRANPGAKKRTAPLARAAEEVLLADFRCRLDAVNLSRVLLIPCGRFSAAFLEKAGISHCPAVPHPAQGQWRRAENRPGLEGMIRRIRECLGEPGRGRPGFSTTG